LNSDSPKVTVLMSVYNGEKYLQEAVESILKQTFRDFEFIIINDGSTDNSSAILTHYEQIDGRIRVCNQENRGLIASLNRGCQLAKGKYIARMDADDLSLPERLARQVDYLETHPDVGVLGTWVEWIDENGISISKVREPTMPNTISWTLPTRNCLSHASVTMRRDVIEQVGFYNPEALHAEDYDLWTRASSITKLANIPEILLRHRIWEGAISSRQLQAQEQTIVKIMHSMATRTLGTEVSIETIVSLRQAISGKPLADLRQIKPIVSLIRQLYRTYLKTNRLNRQEAEEVSLAAGMTLLVLAVSVSKTSLWKGFVVLIQALEFNPRLLLSRQIVTKGRRMLLRRA
jgi:glycosyltransferase involved in cell wall biosynthesis